MSNDQQTDALRAKYWSELVSRLEPYVPGEQPKLSNLVKLNTNENPQPPSPAVIAAIQGAVGDDLRLYPPPDASELKAAVADYYGLSPKQVFAGNGSDEVLAHIFNGLLKHDKPLLFPDITYSFYPVYCRLYDIDFRKIPLRDDFAIAVDDYSTSNGGIIFPNPNAPTGSDLRVRVSLFPSVQLCRQPPHAARRRSSGLLPDRMSRPATMSSR